jgi:hypothetical protein
MDSKSNPKLWALVTLGVALLSCLGVTTAALINNLPDFLSRAKPATQVIVMPSITNQQAQASLATNAPTWTSPPTSVPTLISTPTSLPSQTPQPILPSLTPTAEEATELPNGELLHETFSDPNSGWNRVDEDTYSIDYIDGEYSFQVHEAALMVWSHWADSSFSDIQIETRVRNLSPTDDPSFGILCNYQDGNNYYAAGIDAAGHYAIFKEENDVTTYLSDPAGSKWLLSDDIPEDDISYLLTLRCAAGELALYVNHLLIASVLDANYTSGEVGMFTWTFKEHEADIRFDSLVVKKIP